MNIFYAAPQIIIMPIPPAGDDQFYDETGFNETSSHKTTILRNVQPYKAQTEMCVQ